MNRDAVRRVASASAKKETTGILTQRNSSKSIGRQLQICMDRGHGESTRSNFNGQRSYVNSKGPPIIFNGVDNDLKE